ncbi:transcription antitermination factor NusB [SAR92 clade bacterium H921]|jgi:N utilization substance protein B|nr:transcription antitermination factor NusB [SAR92 clade bacterium H921]MDG0971266.1 transcription antitermination factor NusB [Porticoccaceae bacterium]MDG1308124.1 transcription antitermination factor NusB [Porticoccaceae bacterium]
MSKPKEKQKARRMLVQALYSWDVGGTDLVTIEAEFHTDNDMSKVDTELFHTILFGVPKNLAALDTAYEPYLDRENKELDPVSRAVLRLSCYEMLFSIDVPYKVVINEGVNLAKTYGPTDAYKFINGVLDKVAIEKRAVEVAANRRA